MGSSLLRFIALGFVLLFIVSVEPRVEAAAASVEQPLWEQMRNIPQNHCLRYRKFKLIRRCRRVWKLNQFNLYFPSGKAIA
ncbi:Hypothetical predicted protein [Cloeon dipterum]|uniref:BPTI/Kunitz inhibitor domain-containing protein n=1 Tax=Cloeon dipterum TaxID=197152 RepID=A0A8S1DGZ8_9INSE|nr:Hypothetical predicted protein [Cloeon dipterum]